MIKIVLNGESLDIRGSAGPDGNPIGTVISFMGVMAPNDYLICDGATYNVSDYPDLAAFFQEQFGDKTYFGSDGDGTFKVPDMRNLFLRGYHGEADEQLSGDVGKKQDGTSHPYFFTDTVSGLGVADNIRPYDYDGVINRDKKFVWQTNNIGTMSQEGLYTSRPVNMAVLYCIKAVDSQTRLMNPVEEYDTTVGDCDWHVKKWTNGYCEFMGKRYLENLKITYNSGSWYSSDGPDSLFSGSMFPFALVKKYVECNSIESDINWLSFLIGDRFYDPLVGSSKINFISPSSITNVKCVVNIFVTGRWKEEESPTVNRERITSTVTPKSSGTITQDSNQYDYELPDIVSAASSASADFNGIGSDVHIDSIGSQADIFTVASDANTLEELHEDA